METSSVTGEHSPRHPSSQRRHALGGCSWERGWGDGDHWTVTIWGILTHPKHHRWLVYHMLSRRHFFKITVCNVFFFFFGAGGVEIWRLNPQPRGGLLSTILVGGSSIIIIYIYYIRIYIHTGDLGIDDDQILITFTGCCNPQTPHVPTHFSTLLAHHFSTFPLRCPFWAGLNSLLKPPIVHQYRLWPILGDFFTLILSSFHYGPNSLKQYSSTSMKQWYNTTRYIHLLLPVAENRERWKLLTPKVK